MTDTTTIEPNTFGVTIEPTFVGQSRDNDGWDHFLWSVTLRREDSHNGRRVITIEYRMGLAHLTKGRWQKPPTLVEVLHSLQLDANVLENDELEDIGINEMSYRKGQALEAALHVSRDKTRDLFGREYHAFLETEYDT